MGLAVVITGSPGVGKTSVAKALAGRWGCVYASANEVAAEEGALRREKGSPELVCDLGKLKRALLRLIAQNKGKDLVMEGHLACEVAVPADVVLVLRANPRKLLARYAKRGYSKRKAVANALAEALDYCLVRAEENYGEKRVVQVDATKRLPLAKVELALRRKKTQAVDWSGLLLSPSFSRLVTGPQGR